MIERFDVIPEYGLRDHVGTNVAVVHPVKGI